MTRALIVLSCIGLFVAFAIGVSHGQPGASFQTLEACYDPRTGEPVNCPSRTLDIDRTINLTMPYEGVEVNPVPKGYHRYAVTDLTSLDAKDEREVWLSDAGQDEKCPDGYRPAGIVWGEGSECYDPKAKDPYYVRKGLVPADPVFAYEDSSGEVHLFAKRLREVKP